MCIRDRYGRGLLFFAPPCIMQPPGSSPLSSSSRKMQDVYVAIGVVIGHARMVSWAPLWLLMGLFVPIYNVCHLWYVNTGSTTYKTRNMLFSNVTSSTITSRLNAVCCCPCWRNSRSRVVAQCQWVVTSTCCIRKQHVLIVNLLLHFFLWQSYGFCACEVMNHKHYMSTQCTAEMCKTFWSGALSRLSV